MLQPYINTFPVEQDVWTGHNMSREGKVNHGKHGK